MLHVLVLQSLHRLNFCQDNENLLCSLNIFFLWHRWLEGMIFEFWFSSRHCQQLDPLYNSLLILMLWPSTSAQALGLSLLWKSPHTTVPYQERLQSAWYCRVISPAQWLASVHSSALPKNGQLKGDAKRWKLMQGLRSNHIRDNFSSDQVPHE